MNKIYEDNPILIKLILLALFIWVMSSIGCSTDSVKPTAVETNGIEVVDDFTRITEDDSTFSPPFLRVCDSMGTNIFTPNRVLDSANLQNIYLVVWNPNLTILDTFMKDGVLIMDPILGTANHLGVDPELVCSESLLLSDPIYISGRMSYTDTIGFPEIGTGYDLWDHPHYVLVWGQHFE